ncbi:hypothetical protein MSG28_013203 [Choristoneura fumiferana]|uniref:Uncharacterized protein n=1 Tax=Choristoneura fumiferana TaxID=7141 RepID=A0ACC0KT04_CHOFU|nr:hypothetical protein MSG28_013203 [Choristoneura fumiferana]
MHGNKKALQNYPPLFCVRGTAFLGAPAPIEDSNRTRIIYQTVLETLNMETCPSKGRVDSGRFEETSTFGPASAQCYVTVDGLPRARLTSNL